MGEVRDGGGQGWGRSGMGEVRDGGGQGWGRSGMGEVRDGGGQGWGRSGMGEVRDGEKIFVFCTHIWILREILSIMSIHTWGETKLYPPPDAKNNNFRRLWRQICTKCGPELPKHFGPFEVGGGGGQGQQLGAPRWLRWPNGARGWGNAVRGAQGGDLDPLPVVVTVSVGANEWLRLGVGGVTEAEGVPLTE